ncbi:MAG: hypothetical protein NPIRA06_33770 [Nitrospirales bacterium]|nr:MAG: hypothetical protein NPIRA06_33770 [Nitrospirales bacterium]
MLSGKTGAQSRQPWFLSSIIVAGFRPGCRGTFVSVKMAKTIDAPSGLIGGEGRES